MAKSMYQKREERKQKKLNSGENSGVNKIDINWYPGHMAQAYNEIKKDLKYIDMVCIILDARIPYTSNNKAIYEMVKTKTVIMVFNKSDLADSVKLAKAEKTYQTKGCYTIRTVANKQEGINNLLTRIVEIGEKIKYKTKTNEMYSVMKPKYKVLVAGIPNVGKSSIINAMAKRKSAETGDKPGVTKTKKWIRCTKEIEIMDTPGLLWPKLEGDTGMKLAFVGTIKDEVVDQVLLALEVLQYLKKDAKYIMYLQNRYNLTSNEIGQQEDIKILEQIARNKGCIVSNAEVDLTKVSRMLLDDIRHGKIGNISFE